MFLLTKSKREKIAREARLDALSEAGCALIALSYTGGSKGDREAGIWDAGCYLIEELGDGRLVSRKSVSA